MATVKISNYKTVAKTSPVYQAIREGNNRTYNTRLHLEWNKRNVRLMWKDYLDNNLPNINTGISLHELSNLLNRAYKHPFNIDTEEEKELLRKQLEKLKQTLKF